ncbi:hypothetical protein CLOM_g23405 [Closterium sp. NIES-68]|nr:hypothetical protein CLOM_g23405 [Closterium sp. NIES-68]GJP72982.1 hypothetical protein CLOP_g3747 [Closterium sp. NIES-67]
MPGGVANGDGSLTTRNWTGGDMSGDVTGVGNRSGGDGVTGSGESSGSAYTGAENNGSAYGRGANGSSGENSAP